MASAPLLTLPPALDPLPRTLYRAEQVRRFDRCAIETHGIPGIELMERAGQAAWRLLRARWPTARMLTVLAGVGNNGGDGYVVARLALAAGLGVRLLRVGDPARIGGAAALALAAWRAAGGTVEPYAGLPPASDLIVDALLGTGLERPLAGVWAEAVAAINAQRAPVLALDLPSGLHADTGAILGTAVRATATVSFIGLKQGLYVGAGPDCRGALYFSALGVPDAVFDGEPPAMRRIDWAGCAGQLAPRPRTAHKGQCGQVLIVGGAPGMSGAARLAGEAALRAGAGLVTIATHPAHAAVLNLTRPELMVKAVATPADLEPWLARADAVAIGPGLGQDAWGQALWLRVRALEQPLVVDADALNLLARQPRVGSDWVLTPHPGEAARLLGVTSAAITADRPGAARALQARYGGVAVLKGAGTLIQGGEAEPPAVCSDGNPGLATAGAGDVLTGVLAALRAQGLDARTAAELAVCLHAAAGDRAAAAGGERGLLAGDVIAMLRPTMAEAIPDTSRSKRN